MVAMMRKGMQGRTLFVLLPFAAVALLAFAFVACDTGSAPESATGPDSAYDPLFDEPRAGVTARVRPTSVSVPNVNTGDRSSQATLIGYFRDPNGEPVAGIQMNFTADPVNPNITFNPPAGFTDTNGGASTQVTVGQSTPTGSYVLVAYTSPASAGPNARGQTTLFVEQLGASGVEDLRITTASLSDGTVGVAYSQVLTAEGGLRPYIWSQSGLPGGLTLDSNTGAITGIPAAGGSFLVTVTVMDSNTPPDDDTQIYDININIP